MKHLLILVFALAAFSAKADDIAVIKAKAIVTGENVTLNDLLVKPVAEGKVAIFAAPAPGETGTINVERIIEAAQNYGLKNIAPSNLHLIDIEREARILKSQDVENAVREKAALDLHAKAENIEISFSRDIGDVAIEKTNAAPLQLSYFRHEPQSGRFEARFYVPDSSYLSEASPLTVTGTLNEMAEVVQLTHSLSRGEVISRSDLALVRVKRQQLVSNALRHEGDVVGMIAKRAINESTMLRSGDVEKQKLIARNDMILVLYQTPSMTVTARGKAMMDGTMDDVIEIQNLQSKRSLSATVTGNGQVTVTSLVPRRVAELSTNEK